MQYAMLITILLLSAFCYVLPAKTPIYLLGLYPFTGSFRIGDTVFGASKLAVQHVNEDQRILQDYELVIIPADTNVSFTLIYPLLLHYRNLNHTILSLALHSS